MAHLTHRTPSLSSDMSTDAGEAAGQSSPPLSPRLVHVHAEGDSDEGVSPPRYSVAHGSREESPRHGAARGLREDSSPLGGGGVDRAGAAVASSSSLLSSPVRPRRRAAAVSQEASDLDRAIEQSLLDSGGSDRNRAGGRARIRHIDKLDVNDDRDRVARDDVDVGGGRFEQRMYGAGGTSQGAAGAGPASSSSSSSSAAAAVARPDDRTSSGGNRLSGRDGGTSVANRDHVTAMVPSEGLLTALLESSATSTGESACEIIVSVSCRVAPAPLLAFVTSLQVDVLSCTFSSLLHPCISSLYQHKFPIHLVTCACVIATLSHAPASALALVCLVYPHAISLCSR
jgi:hypothetical protein